MGISGSPLGNLQRLARPAPPALHGGARDAANDPMISLHTYPHLSAPVVRLPNLHLCRRSFKCVRCCSEPVSGCMCLIAHRASAADHHHHHHLQQKLQQRKQTAGGITTTCLNNVQLCSRVHGFNRSSNLSDARVLAAVFVYAADDIF